MKRFKISCASGGAPRTKRAYKIERFDGEERLEPRYEIEIGSLEELLSIMKEERRPLILYGADDDNYDGEFVVYDDYIE
jgi:hypothetical protein